MPQATESRNSCKQNPRKKKQLLVFKIKLKGLGCKGASSTASAPQLVRSAPDSENRNKKRKNKQKRKKQNTSAQVQRYPRDVVIDVPDHICCAPPGIGINASDVAPRNRNTVPRNDERKIASVPRRNRDDPVPDIREVLSRNIRSRVHHRSAMQIIEMLMLQQDLASGRVIPGYNRHQEWRLDADDMTYEELADLSDKIGCVSTGLGEEEMLNCIRIPPKPLNACFTISDEDWKCSICQDDYRRNEDIGTLNCGHQHHLQCLKQWLRQKNECPICKSAAFVKS